MVADVVDVSAVRVKIVGLLEESDGRPEVKGRRGVT